MHPLDQPKYAAEHHALIHDGRNSADSDYRILSSSGEWRWVNVRTRVIERDADGRALRIVGACIDVDSRRRAEQALRTQAIILETMREGVVLLDLDGRIEFTNPAFDHMFGREPDELAGTSVRNLLNIAQKRQSPTLAIEGLFDHDGRRGRRDMLFRRRDGTQFAGEVLSADIELSAGKRILVVVQDVSERKRLEAQITEIASHERRRLSADLHDGLGQELTGISLMLREPRHSYESSGISCRSESQRDHCTGESRDPKRAQDGAWHLPGGSGARGIIVRLREAHRLVS